jgi:hypothetical protein
VTPTEQPPIPASEPSLSAQLRDLHERKGVTYSRMARWLDVDDSTVNDWVHGKRPIPAHWVEEVSRLIGELTAETRSLPDSPPISRPAVAPPTPPLQRPAAVRLPAAVKGPAHPLARVGSYFPMSF